MRINLGETMESWANRVQMFEKGHAMQRIAQGDDIEQVIDDMGRRIKDKLMHPILKSLSQEIPSKVNLEDSRKKYEEIMKNVARAPDHVDTDT